MLQPKLKFRDSFFSHLVQLFACTVFQTIDSPQSCETCHFYPWSLWPWSCHNNLNILLILIVHSQKETNIRDIKLHFSPVFYFEIKSNPLGTTLGVHLFYLSLQSIAITFLTLSLISVKAKQQIPKVCCLMIKSLIILYANRIWLRNQALELVM